MKCHLPLHKNLSPPAVASGRLGREGVGWDWQRPTGMDNKVLPPGTGHSAPSPVVKTRVEENAPKNTGVGPNHFTRTHTCKSTALCFKWSHLWHMDVPRPGMESEPQRPPRLDPLLYFIFCLFRATLTAFGGSQARGRIGAGAVTQDPSHVCDPRHTSQLTATPDP